MVVKIGMHRQSYKNVSNIDYIGRIAGDTLKPQTSTRKFMESFVSKKFTLEAIVQVARSLGTKSLDGNQIFSLRGMSVAFTNTDLEPLNDTL